MVYWLYSEYTCVHTTGCLSLLNLVPGLAAVYLVNLVDLLVPVPTNMVAGRCHVRCVLNLIRCNSSKFSTKFNTVVLNLDLYLVYPY